MNNKKKIILIVVAIILTLGIIAGALALYFTRYNSDDADTEEFFRQNVASVNYENTIETAYPQTDLYKIIEEHFNSELPEGKTEKKVAVIGYDGCRADILAECKENGAVKYLLSKGASINLTYCGGVNYPEVNTQDTSTAPGWCSILTGVWADKNGITGNGITKEIEPKTIMTLLVEDGTIDSASFITKWKGHFTNNNSTYIDEKAYCEENNINVVAVANDGMKALECIEKFSPDVVTLDIVMPKLDGIGVLEKLKDKPEENRPKVIVVTNNSGEHTMSLCMKYGADYYMLKALKEL